MKVNDNDKFAPHNEIELAWANQMHSLNDYFKTIGVEFQRGIRLGRQVKAYNSTGVGVFHIYLYRDNTFELWINGHHCDKVTVEMVKKYVNAAVERTLNSSKRDRYTRTFKSQFETMS